jgi:cytochrome oxidase Cu insertion factor (SCO1/SenC/PrrC family)
LWQRTGREDYSIDHTGVTYLVGREGNISASGRRRRGRSS